MVTRSQERNISAAMMQTRMAQEQEMMQKNQGGTSGGGGAPGMYSVNGRIINPDHPGGIMDTRGPGAETHAANPNDGPLAQYLARQPGGIDWGAAAAGSNFGTAGVVNYFTKMGRPDIAQEVQGHQALIQGAQISNEQQQNVSAGQQQQLLAGVGQAFHNQVMQGADPNEAYKGFAPVLKQLLPDQANDLGEFSPHAQALMQVGMAMNSPGSAKGDHLSKTSQMLDEYQKAVASGDTEGATQLGAELQKERMMVDPATKQVIDLAYNQGNDPTPALRATGASSLQQAMNTDPNTPVLGPGNPITPEYAKALGGTVGGYGNTYLGGAAIDPFQAQAENSWAAQQTKNAALSPSEQAFNQMYYSNPKMQQGMAEKQQLLIDQNNPSAGVKPLTGSENDPATLAERATATESGKDLANPDTSGRLQNTRLMQGLVKQMREYVQNNDGSINRTNLANSTGVGASFLGQKLGMEGTPNTAGRDLASMGQQWASLKALTDNKKYSPALQQQMYEAVMPRFLDSDKEVINKANLQEAMSTGHANFITEAADPKDPNGTIYSFNNGAFNQALGALNNKAALPEVLTSNVPPQPVLQARTQADNSSQTFAQMSPQQLHGMAATWDQKYGQGYLDTLQKANPNTSMPDLIKAKLDKDLTSGLIQQQSPAPQQTSAPQGAMPQTPAQPAAVQPTPAQQQGIDAGNYGGNGNANISMAAVANQMGAIPGGLIPNNGG